MKTKLVFFLACFLAIVTRDIHAAPPTTGGVFENRDIRVLFEPSLRSAAIQITNIYPGIKSDLEGIFGWDLNLRPSILLIKDSKHFLRMSGNPLTVAFAVPAKNLIVIDHSKMNIHPFTIGITLKHELCHLLLHHQIRETSLPRWLDEGIAQWVSDGISEIITGEKGSRLNKAALRGRFIPLVSLESAFPHDKEGLLLAYEESESFVEYVIGQFGKEGILSVLEHMRKGEDTNEAFLKALSIPWYKLEKQWHHSLSQKMTWFTYLSYHLYEILFALMALITVYAFIRAVIKKRAYTEEEKEEGGI